MVQAAPNATTIRFKVLEKETDQNAPNKTHLKIEVLPAEAHHDQRFIKPGAVMQGFTFDQVETRAGAVFMADAEYIGGPRGGYVHLKNLQPQK
jgi:hypothetical protein